MSEMLETKPMQELHEAKATQKPQEANAANVSKKSYEAHEANMAEKSYDAHEANVTQELNAMQEKFVAEAMSASFNAAVPPVLTEAELRAELERRRLKRQMVLVTAVCVALQVSAIIFAIITRASSPLVFVTCVSYVGVSTLACGACALLFSQNGRRLSCL